MCRSRCGTFFALIELPRRRFDMTEERYQTIKTHGLKGSEANPLVCAKLRWRGKGHVKVLQMLFRCCLLLFNLSSTHIRVALIFFLKKAGIIQSITNKTFFFLSSNPLYHPFPSCSLSSLYLRASFFIIRTTLWEAIREKLTQLPASLSRLQPHQASPPPSPLWPGWLAITMEGDWRAVKYLLMLHLALGNCPQTRSRKVKHIYTPATHKGN